MIFLLDNRALPINRKQKVFPNGTLIIENVERTSDQATYTCVAKNAEGYSARGSLEVQVMGKFLKFFSMVNIAYQTNVDHQIVFIFEEMEGSSLSLLLNGWHKKS